jgi:hypothetical protein
MADGFLGRWSKRKLEVKQATAVPPPQPSPGGGGSESPEPSPERAGSESPQPSPGGGGSEARLSHPPPPGEGGGIADPQPAPTLEDVRALTPQSDFARFIAPDVAHDVKNAALKKLFADPRYNVMDRLDVYIDDYSQPDPMPQSMLRQLNSAKVLNLFKAEEEEKDPGAGPLQGRDVADNPDAQSVAQSESVPESVPEAVPEPSPHADPDLRLQQDHAAAGQEPGRGTE